MFVSYILFVLFTWQLLWNVSDQVVQRCDAILQERGCVAFVGAATCGTSWVLSARSLRSGRHEVDLVCSAPQHIVLALGESTHYGVAQLHQSFII